MSFNFLQEDFNRDRNSEMIKVLLQKDSIGSFLFFVYGKKDYQAPGFILPPGLTDAEAKQFQKEFLDLFGRYAIIAMRRKGSI